MSVINEVLNQLEQRGVDVSAEQVMVRPVATPRASRNIGVLWGAVALLLLLVGGYVGRAYWFTSPVSRPVAAVPQPMSMAVDVVSAVMPTMEVALAPPASRMSFELSFVPVENPVQPEKTITQPPASVAHTTPVATARPANIASAAIKYEAVHGELVAPPTLRQAQGERGEKLYSSRINSVASPAQAHQPLVVANAPHQAEGAHPVGLKSDVPAKDSVGLKQISATQHADAEFRKAIALMQQGRIADAQAGYQAALQLDPAHDTARQAWVALLIEDKRLAEAELILQEGLKIHPAQSGFAMLLARLQVQSGELDAALLTLQSGADYAEKNAEYLAFYAALLQRKNQHPAALLHYQAALRLQPNKGVWLMGYGLSLQALARNAEAKQALQQALATQTLSPELQAFVQQKITGL